MLMASILDHKKIRKDIEVEGYQVNLCDVCVVSRETSSKQHAFACHACKVKASHEDGNVNEKLYKWDEKKYGSDELGHATVTRGKYTTI